MSELHEEVATPSWDTKVECSCGVKEASRAQLWLHQATALRAVLAGVELRPIEEGLR